MQKKTALVTGANTGMGKETAIALAKAGMRVVMLCRDRARGEAALLDVQRQSGGGDVALMLCDLGEMASIRRFCGAFHETCDRLDVLVNNAGVLYLRRQETKDGLEAHFGVNHIGHFLLTNLLLDLMPPFARVVTITSSAHKVGRIDFDNLDLKKGYSVVSGYSRSKLCAVLFTKELARRLSGTGITANCVHPGMVASSIAINRRTGFGKTITRVLGWLVQTPAEGAATAVHVATSEACEGVTGEYFTKCRIARASKRSLDAALAARLWDVSAEIAEVTSAKPSWGGKDSLRNPLIAPDPTNLRHRQESEEKHGQSRRRALE